jgi:hypothetical protein
MKVILSRLEKDLGKNLEYRKNNINQISNDENDNNII